MNIDKLKEEQLAAAQKVVSNDDFGKVKTVGGADCAYTDDKVIAAVVVCDAKTLEVIEVKTASVKIGFPYLSGLLYYREGKAIEEAFKKLDQKPDVLLVDGNGLLHPLRCGMASQIGVELDQPTIGVAKTRLLGEEDEAGNISVGNDILGLEIKMKEHSKPFYVSIGHRISLEKSAAISQRVVKPPHKLPEPLHLAHRMADKAKKN
jgi:deoxyribonuclease V